MSDTTYYALSVHQPFASAIVLGHKPIENREWGPWAKVLHQRLFIHATKKTPELADVAHVAHLCGLPQSEVLQWPTGAIVGSVTVLGTASNPEYLTPEARRWWVGPKAWILTKPKAIIQPFAMPGAQSLWAVPPDALAELSRPERWPR